MGQNKISFQAGQLVTWGSGEPRGEVVAVVPERGDSPVLVALVTEQKGACGRSFPAGTSGWFPIEELRLVQ